MSHYFSLVLFTILSQCAVGMMIALSFRSDECKRCLWVALCFLALGALASLCHLGDPWICFLTLGNIGSSWLSREIAMCVIFGLSILACIFFGKRWLAWLSAALGVLFIYVMARVYMIPTEAAWDSPITFFYFLAAALMLGYSVLLILESLDKSAGNPLLGKAPYVLMAAMGFSLLFLFLRMPQSGAPARTSAIWYIILLIAGAGIALPAFMRHAAGENAGKSGGLAPAFCVAALIWIAELCGRASFYKSYTWFGM